MSKYTTKVTRCGSGWICRVSHDGKPVVQTKVISRLHIGPAFRDMLRTIDTCGGDTFTDAARNRKSKPGNISIDVKHNWVG
jgi:hypothetical protein